MRSLVLGALGCVAAAAPAGAQAQIEKFTSVTSYALSMPTGDTRQFVATPSWFGLAWEGVWAIGRHTSTGVAFSFHDFNSATSGTTTFDWGAATGHQARDLFVTTAMAMGRWYPLAERSRRPYLGLEAGIVYSEQVYQLGLSQTARAATHLAVAPEAGWQFPLVNGVDGVVSARYTIPTRSGPYIGGARSNPFATLSFGVLER